MIVVDASAVIELLLGRASAPSIARRVAASEGAILAPHLIDVEVVQVLRRLAALGVIDAARAQIALEYLHALGIRRHAHDVLVPRIWALRANATAYAAAYLALAEATGAPLITTDPKLARVPGSRAIVEVMA